MSISIGGGDLRVTVSGASTIHSLATMSDLEKHVLAATIKQGQQNQQGRSNRCYENAMNMIFHQSDEVSRSTFFDDAVVQQILLEGVIGWTVKDERIINALRNCTVDISPEQQNQILNDKLVFLLGTIAAHPEAAVAFRFFTDPLARATIAEYMSPSDIASLWSNPAVLEVMM